MTATFERDDRLRLDTLLHILGLDERHADSYRNHYVTGAAVDVEVVALIELGLVVETDAPAFLPAGDRTFCATARGRSVALAERRRRYPPPSRSHARYARWLNVADCWPISFGDFLRRRLYDEDVMREVLAESRSTWNTLTCGCADDA